MLGAALDAYCLDNGRYPTTEEGLAALWQAPTNDPRPMNWRGPYLRRVVPLDSWRAAYLQRNDARTVVPIEYQLGLAKSL
jgi:general secretion pathway protein G